MKYQKVVLIISLTETTVIWDAEGNETDFSALSAGVMVTVETDDDGSALSITVSDNKGGMQMGAAPGKPLPPPGQMKMPFWWKTALTLLWKILP